MTRKLTNYIILSRYVDSLSLSISARLIKHEVMTVAIRTITLHTEAKERAEINICICKCHAKLELLFMSQMEYMKYILHTHALTWKWFNRYCNYRENLPPLFHQYASKIIFPRMINNFTVLHSITFCSSTMCCVTT